MKLPPHRDRKYFHHAPKVFLDLFKINSCRHSFQVTSDLLPVLTDRFAFSRALWKWHHSLLSCISLSRTQIRHGTACWSPSPRPVGGDTITCLFTCRRWAASILRPSRPSGETVASCLGAHILTALGQNLEVQC